MNPSSEARMELESIRRRIFTREDDRGFAWGCALGIVAIALCGLLYFVVRHG